MHCLAWRFVLQRWWLRYFKRGSREIWKAISSLFNYDFFHLRIRSLWCTLVFRIPHEFGLSRFCALTSFRRKRNWRLGGWTSIVTWLLWKRRVLIRLVSSFPAFSSAFDFTAVIYSLQIEAVLAVKGMLIKTWPIHWSRRGSWQRWKANWRMRRRSWRRSDSIRKSCTTRWTAIARGEKEGEIRRKGKPLDWWRKWWKKLTEGCQYIVLLYSRPTRGTTSRWTSLLNARMKFQSFIDSGGWIGNDYWFWCIGMRELDVGIRLQLFWSVILASYLRDQISCWFHFVWVSSSRRFGFSLTLLEWLW